MIREFKLCPINMGIIIKNRPVKVHYSRDIVERYYEFLYRVDSIIITKIASIQPDMVLQIAFNAINNLAGPNMLVLTVLVFGTYLRMTKQYISSQSIIQHAVALQKAMNELRK